MSRYLCDLVSVSYAHEFEDDSQSTTATLPGGSRFGVSGAELDSAILLGVGTGFSITPNLGVNVGYRGEITTGDGLDSHGGTFGVNYTF
jgi:outer membrane autotransporter protein